MKKKADHFSKFEIIQVADIYERLYYQFVDLMNFSYKLAGTYRKSDAVAAMISEEVGQIEGVYNNTVWVVTGPESLIKMAQNGKMVSADDRQCVDWSSIDELGNVISSQKVAWGPFSKQFKEIFKDFRSPTLFPIRGADIAQGLVVVDHAEAVDIERCQYITKFAAMILEMSNLYFRLEDEINERRQLETLLTQENNKAQTYLDVAQVMLVALDRQGRVDLINRKGCEILGYPPKEVLGKNWFENFVKESDRANLEKTFSDALSHDAQWGKYIENEIVTRSGDSRIIEWYNARVRDADGNVSGTISCGVDVTEQRKFELEKQAIQAQLFQAQKIEAIGTLVGGIAHDFNNMLQAIIGYSELLLDEIEQGQRGRRGLETIFQTAKGGAELVRKLMVFGQQAMAYPVNFDLNRQIRELQTLLVGSLPQQVNVVLDLCDQPVMVHADQNLIDQCIMNLAINGAEAMPEGGTLTIKTQRILLDEEFCKANADLEPGDHVLLSITDTGRGMDEKTLSRIYDPFFSTKQRGSTRGTGLGLSVVKGMLSKHNSLITCESAPGKGTTFRIYFKDAAASDVGCPNRSTSPPSGASAKSTLIVP